MMYSNCGALTNTVLCICEREKKNKNMVLMLTDSRDSYVGLFSSSGSLYTTDTRFSHLAQCRCFLWGTGLGHEVRVGAAGTSRDG